MARMRASNAEREQVAQVLRTAMTEGRLSLAEGDERLAKVYEATYRDELHPLVADLPGGGWHALADTPEARAEVRRHWRGHVGVVAAISIVLIGLWALSGAHFFWPVFPLIFLAIGLVKHYRWHRYGWPAGPGWRYHRYGAGHAPPWVR